MKQITVISQDDFIALCSRLGYMTITKDYGLIAWHDGNVVGQFITEGPHGPIDNPTGYISLL